MPGLRAPLFSLGARGTLAKTLTYASWRGIDYVRERVVPANPQSVAQTNIRNVFANLNLLWLYMPTGGQAPWNAAASGQPFTNRNKYLSDNIPLAYGDTDVDDVIGSPGVGGAPAPSAVVATPGVSQLAVNLTVGTLPTGWTLIAGHAIAIRTTNPQATPGIQTPIGYDTDANPTLMVITGLAADLYYVKAWAEYTNPSGATTYTVSLQTTGTPT